MSHDQSPSSFNGSTPHEHGGNAAASAFPQKNGRVTNQPLSYYRNGTGTRIGDLRFEDIASVVRKTLAIVRTRWIAGLLSAAVLGGCLGYLAFRKQPEYTAVTSILAQSTLDEILHSNANAPEGKIEQETFLRNHLSVMRSRGFSVSLAEQFSPEEAARILGPYLEPGEEPTSTRLELLLARNTEANRDRGQESFALAFNHTDPEVAVMVSNRMASAYIDLVQKELQQANEAAANILRAQANGLKSEIADLEDNLRNYRKENNIVAMEENRGVYALRLEIIEREKMQIRINRVALETRLNKAKADLENNPMPFENETLAGFGNLASLRGELDALNGQKEILSTRYGPNHSRMRDIETSIRGVRETIVTNFRLAYDELDSQLQNAISIEQELDREFQEAFNNSIEVGRLAERFAVLRGDIEAKREALRDILRRVNEASVMSRLPADVMRVVDSAYIKKPFLPKRVIHAGLAGVLSLFAFVAVPLLLNMFDQKIKNATDIEGECGRELIGGVPKLASVDSRDRPHIVRDNVEPAHVEPFLSIVAQLELISSQPEQKTFLVTSSCPGEGKSTIASNLASGFAKLNRRTLLIDCDFRRPTQSLIHDVNGRRGGFLPWAAAGFKTEGIFDEKSDLGIQKLPDGTHLLPSGGDHPQPTQFLVSVGIKKLFELLKQRYEVLILDTPPVGLFADALILARYAPEAVLVAREGKAPVAQIRRAISDFEKTPASVLGLVLNDFSSSNMNPRLAYTYAYGSYSRNGKSEQKELISAAARVDFP